MVMTAADLAARVHAKRRGKEWVVACPAHPDRDPSLEFSDGDKGILFRCRSRQCSVEAILAAWDLTLADVMTATRTTPPHAATFTPFVYRDVDGTLLYQSVRRQAPGEKKTFFVQHPDGSGGWAKGLGKARRVPYRLNELPGQHTVFIPEGEKHCDRLFELGIPATCNLFGAGKWTAEDTAALVAAGVTHVIVLPDNDEPGRDHGQLVARTCHAAGLRVQVVTLPNLSEKGDILDWLSDGHTIDELAALVHTTPVWTREASATDTPLAAERLDDFLARVGQTQDVLWLIGGLIPVEGIALWHGQPRDYKSFCALELGLALAAGRPAFHVSRFAPARAARVLYLTEEDPEKLIAARLHWLTQRAELPSGQFFLAVRKALTFDAAESRADLLTVIRSCEPELVIIDPLRSYTGMSDKGPADFRPVTVFLRQIQRETTAKALLLVHHDTKPNANGQDDRSRSQQASGGGIFSIADCPASFRKTEWNKCAVFPEDFKLSGNPQPFEVTFESDTRYDASGAPRFGSYITPRATTASEHTIEAATVEARVLRYLADNPAVWLTARRIETGARLKNGRAAEVLRAFAAAGSVAYATGQSAIELGAETATTKLYKFKGPVPATGTDENPSHSDAAPNRASDPSVPLKGRGQEDRRSEPLSPHLRTGGDRRGQHPAEDDADGLF